MDYPKKIILQTGRYNIQLLNIEEALGESKYAKFCKAYENKPNEIEEQLKKLLTMDFAKYVDRLLSK